MEYVIEISSKCDEATFKKLCEDLATNCKTRTLKVYDQDVFYLPPLLNLLTRNHTIQQLILWHNNLTDKDFEALFEALYYNRGVRRVYLSGNRFKEKLRAALWISTSTTLTHLHLSDCGITDEGAIGIADGLLLNHSVIYLDLSENRIEEQGIVAFAWMLQENSTLESLILASHPTTLQGTHQWIEASEVMAEALRINQTLKALDLSHRQSLDMTLLLEGLKENRALVTLDCWRTNVKTEGATVLSYALAYHPTLRNLCLHNCCIDEDGLDLIAQALAMNDTLRTLDLSFNPISEMGVGQIIDALRENEDSILEWVDLSQTQIYSDQIKEIARILRHHHQQRAYRTLIQINQRRGNILYKDIMKHIIGFI